MSLLYSMARVRASQTLLANVSSPADPATRLRTKGVHWCMRPIFRITGAAPFCDSILSSCFVNNKPLLVPSPFPKRAYFPSGSKSLMSIVLIRHKIFGLSALSSAMRGYCTSKQRSIPCLTVSIKHGNTRFTPSVVSRCCRSNLDQRSCTAKNMDCIACPVKRESPDSLLTASVSQYIKCASKPMSRGTSGSQRHCRTHFNSKGSRFRVRSSKGNRSLTQFALLLCTSSKETSIGFLASTRYTRGTSKFNVPVVGHGTTCVEPSSSFLHSQAKGKMNFCFNVANSRLKISCCSRSTRFDAPTFARNGRSSWPPPAPPAPPTTFGAPWRIRSSSSAKLPTAGAPTASFFGDDFPTLMAPPTPPPAPPVPVIAPVSPRSGATSSSRTMVRPGTLGGSMLMRSAWPYQCSHLRWSWSKPSTSPMRCLKGGTIFTASATAELRSSAQIA
mmetsp:Transcript_123517/g.349160  ORF Transcript_123517/g.349160 Transcript_123517/m.349160 type:complete len:445 (+) Transcript_123517:251-1585(+)